ncbi:putative DNA-directed DNA polymerase [Helianthus debilis subsp. tardiflorus]
MQLKSHFQPAKMKDDTRRRRRGDRNISKKRKFIDENLDSKFGFDAFTEGEKRLGWLLTFTTSSWEDTDTQNVYSCVDLYFVRQDGSTFKVKYKFRPYFYAATKDKMGLDVDAYLRRRYQGQIADIQIVEKEDLDLKNHLSGLQNTYLKISFDTVQQLMQVKSDLMHVVERNKEKSNDAEAYESIYAAGKSYERIQDCMDCIVDLREYDVPYHVRFAIDNDIRSGLWYDVNVSSDGVTLERRHDLLQRAEVHVCAFDIETTKLPLKFPDAEYDLVMMISYMVDGQGYLIINRECVGEDIEDLEYTPKPEFEGQFKVTNVKNEEELIKLWFSRMREVKPGIYVTYNGDFFDWPFLENRAAHHGLRMNDELGFQCDKIQGECCAKFACHLDCFAWVKRDSYLPQGSHGLKAVTKAKLGYDPLEVNPEDMVRFAIEKPQMMASYSVSDAVSTYYLYMTYVHPFIFSLATIIPMTPDEVLRKGSGTLCETLLMVQAYKANVVCPNKHQAEPEKFYNNRLLESETYIGGHVECLETGVFRSDLPTSFKLDPSAFNQLIENLDRDLKYAINVEGKMELEDGSNYDEVKNAIMEKLIALRDEPTREEYPLIYHLDVAAMYPNIILTNRLQPPSVVTDEVCTACDFNRPGKTCLRNLEWEWRGETYTAKRSDYYHIKRQIESEFVDGLPSKAFLDLPKADQQLKLKERLKKYCQKAYKRVLEKPVTETRKAGICMRENPFYVDTVRSFRDRRYEYKGLNKVWKGRLSEAKASGNPIKIQEAQDMVVLYDSLQLAHKCILNSFYGYVMRKGARWYSMEMAGVVTYTGAKIIQNAHSLIKKIGRPLELDTDGIWCALPGSFPENFTFRDSKKKLTISYPCVMLNADVFENNRNKQYQTLVDPINRTYTEREECSIEFEVDGPYKAMILPASKEEGILLKKRYAVFNEDGTLAELKGFEIKRRGELKLIKVFQAELFEKFLHGSTLEECYSVVSSVANRWLDLLDNQGKDIADSELLDYISESSTMSKSLADYGEQKSCAVTTARRLADFLGDTMVKDKGLRCQYVVACEPRGNPVSERAVPVAIFETDAELMKFYLKKWCKISSDFDIRSIIDWSYYKQRLSSAIQKIITIPAAMQKVSNPVPRVVHPDWLYKKVREKEDKMTQRKLVDFFSSVNKINKDDPKNDAIGENHDPNEQNVADMEDFGSNGKSSGVGPRPIARSYETKRKSSGEGDSSKKKIDSDHSGNLPASSAQAIDVDIEDIDRHLDYQGWLDSKKRKWKKVREKKKRQRYFSTYKLVMRLNGLRTLDESNQRNGAIGIPSGVANTRRAQGTGVGSFFRRQELALIDSHWQIIQLVPSSQNGQFFAWVVVDGTMHKVLINVPRVFYLNSKAPVTEQFPGRLVNKILPHGHNPYNLIEVVTDEDQFMTESRKLAAHLADPEVEGIYETKVGLDFNFILQIGCVCKVDKSVKKRNAQDGWSLSELHMKTTTECSYLASSISFFYLYHSISDQRGIYLVYFPSRSTTHAVMVTPVQNKELSPHILEKQFREACHALSVKPPMPRDAFTFKVDYVGKAKDAQKVLQRAISEIRSQLHGPVIAVVECPNVASVKSGIRALDDFPCVNILSNARDSQYPALGWQIVAAKIGMCRCATSSRWLNEKISLSRYSHVPVGNIELDWRIQTADIFFARVLRDQKQMLWVSDNGIPDLGGDNEEETCYFDEVNQPVLICDGAYRKVTVELKIHNLAVTALLVEFDEDLTLGSHELSELDEATPCVHAFRALRALIQRCVADAMLSGNIFADELSQHVYRWLCSPRSKLHDPALLRMLQKAMNKVLALLLREFRNLGSTIIFANYSKVILDTGKADLNAAQTYCGSLLKILQESTLFKWIELEPTQFWHSLLFMDQYNYGGIQSRPDQTSNGSQVDIVSRWNIADSLPKETQDHFTLIVSEFLYLPWKFAQDQASKRANVRDDDSCTPSITAAAAETFQSSFTEHLRKQIESYFTHKLLKIVSAIVLHVREKGKSHALELIKHVCAVLELDQNVQPEIQVMKKNLLKLVHVREFASEAQFQKCSIFFTLPNVICSYCNDCRDIDLRENSALLSQEWRCSVPECGQPYDREMMENSLLQIARQRERTYHLQDLVCLKCKQIKAAHLAEHCGCAGSFNLKESATLFKDKMEVLLNIAVYQKFELLKECVSWILELS